MDFWIFIYLILRFGITVYQRDYLEQADEYAETAIESIKAMHTKLEIFALLQTVKLRAVACAHVMPDYKS